MLKYMPKAHTVLLVPLNLGEVNALDASGDSDFHPDHLLQHGDEVSGDGWTLTGLHTPGHTANHMSICLEGHRIPVSRRPCHGLGNQHCRAPLTVR